MTRLDELNIGDQWLTPAVRWETVTGFGPDDGASYLLQVFTDTLPEGYGWPLPRRTEVHAVTSAELAAPRAVAVWESRTHVWAELTSSPHSRGFGRDRDAVPLVNARQIGQGQGWQIFDHPNGGPLVVTTAPGKPAARSAVTRAARAHAKALNVPFRSCGAASW